MENLDALLTDLQAATAAMMALNDSQELSNMVLAAAVEDSSVDATWGSASCGAEAAAPFPRMLPSPTSPPADGRNGWHNGFTDSGSGLAGFPSPHSKKLTAPAAAAPRESPAVTTPLLFGPRVVTKDSSSSPAQAANSMVMANHFGRSSVSAAASPQVALGNGTPAPVVALPLGGVAAMMPSGSAPAITPSGGVAAIMSSDGKAVASGRGVRDASDVERDPRYSLPPAVPPPPSRDIVDSFYRDMAAEESLYEPQNLAAHRKMSAPVATEGATVAAELRWRSPQLRTQPASGGSMSSIVRSSLAHNLCELDTLLQELGAAPQQAQHSDFATASGSVASNAVQPPFRSPSVAQAAEGTPGHHTLYSPVLPRAGAELQQQQRWGQPAAAGMLQSEAERNGVGQPTAAAVAPVDPTSASRQQQLQRQQLQQQQPASFATRELDELMTMLSLLKVNTSASSASSSASPPQSSGPASPAQRYVADRQQQQQQYAHVRPPAALADGLRSPDKQQQQQQQSPMGVAARQQLQQPATLNGQATSARWNGSPIDGSRPSSAMSSPRSPRGDLDNMLGHLETDLSRQGAGVVTKGHCAACDKAVVGQVVTALGRLWHPEHFCCTRCRCELARVSFFERDGQPYCEHDYHELFAPKCARCGDSVISKCVTALGITWHPECFTCAACGRTLSDEGFHEKDGSVYCMEDFFDLFSPRCGSCGMPIYDNFVAALNRHWHPACFACMDCGAAFSGSSFFDHDGLPYCETHYHSRKGSLCAGCQKPVSGRCIAAMSKKFHPEHFVCAFCLRQLNKGTFKEQNDKPYCHACFAKLFS